MRRTSKNVPKGFDSWLEYDLAQVLKADYHSCTVPYVQYKNYEPDFILTTGKKTIYIEAKGRFRDKAEARKYVDVKASLPKDCELIFIFQRPSTPMPHSKVRKDGTRFTHANWADKHGFRYYAADDLPKELLK
jgi:predicted nuclease of restriction endonuclease-like RecB superfamily